MEPDEIRRIRRLLDETQAQFAHRLHVDPVTVARWETGVRCCTGLHAATIAKLDPHAEEPVREVALPRLTWGVLDDLAERQQLTLREVLEEAARLYVRVSRGRG